MPETILFDQCGNPLSEGDIVIWDAPDGTARFGCVWHFGPCRTRDNGAYNPGGLIVWYWDDTPHPQETGHGKIAQTALRDTSGVSRIEVRMIPEPADGLKEPASGLNKTADGLKALVGFSEFLMKTWPEMKRCSAEAVTT